MLKRLLGRRIPDPAVGALYATPSEDGYMVLKVLAVDDRGIHVRMYSNRYATVPTEPPGDLEMVGLGPDFEERRLRGEQVAVPRTLGIGHMPFSREAFNSWERHLLGVVPVDESELDGYHMFLEDDGGVFG